MTHTIEEAIDKYYENMIDSSNIDREHYEQEIKDLMIYAADEWQQEQDKNKYSEKEVIAIVEKSRATGLNAEYLIEQFKNK